MTTGDGQSTDDQPTTGRHRSRPGTWGIVLRVAGALVLVGIVWAGWTFQRTWSESDGEPMSVVVATWMRDNNMGPLVARLEDVYYRYVDKPEEGGVPTLSADLSALDAEGTDDSDIEGVDTQAAEPTAPADDSVPVLISPDGSPALPTASPDSSTAPAGSGSTGASAQALRPHLLPPPTIVSPVKNPEPKEGEWQPVASRVDGQPAVYVTRVRADDVHTGYYASVMWIDTKLASAKFVPGYQEPGGPNPSDGALPEKYWPDVLANFNGGFRLDDSQGGYYYDGKMVRQLVDGKASTVIYKDGSIEVGKWGRDLRMSKDVEVVRQNLNLIVDKGKSKVANGADNVVWGATTDKESLAWRAAIGQRTDGSIVYVGSPYLSAQSLADVLVGAGVQRAMVLDMNNWWTAGFFFRHKKDGTPLCRKLDPAIQEGCDRFLKPYKRDSFHFLARPAPATPATSDPAVSGPSASSPTPGQSSSSTSP